MVKSCAHIPHRSSAVAAKLALRIRVPFLRQQRDPPTECLTCATGLGADADVERIMP